MQLPDTGSARLVHINDHNDTFWGCNGRSKGEDQLGKMLMQTRKELGEQARADDDGQHCESWHVQTCENSKLRFKLGPSN